MTLITQLTNQLKQLEGVTVDTYKDTDLLCVFYHGKELGHFHNDHEIDMRLLPKFVKQMGMGPAQRSERHPHRSLKSRWRPLQFHSESDVAELVEIVQKLTEFTDKNG